MLTYVDAHTSGGAAEGRGASKAAAAAAAAGGAKDAALKTSALDTLEARTAMLRVDDAMPRVDDKPAATRAAGAAAAHSTAQVTYADVC